MGVNDRVYKRREDKERERQFKYNVMTNIFMKLKPVLSLCISILMGVPY
jgi:hypothetical protein